MKNKKELYLILMIIVDVSWFASIILDTIMKRSTLLIVIDIITTILFTIITIIYYKKSEYFITKKIKKDSLKK